MQDLRSILFAALAIVLAGCGGSIANSPPPIPTPGTAPEWTWMSGSNAASQGVLSGQPGAYGTLGVASAGNLPGERGDAASWTDKNGNFWLFGGSGFDSAGTFGLLNDLWEFSPATNEWTWIGGSSALGTYPCGGDYGNGQPSIYGTLGVPAVTNVPGGREDSASWTDSEGNLWLFGGYGCLLGESSYLNDLWEFSPTTETWTWVSGSNTAPPISGGGQPGIYGTLGTPFSANTPGGRTESVSWTDSSGNFWLFGGLGVASTENPVEYVGSLNDLWEFNPQAKTWTWMSGANTTGASGVYGTLGAPSTGGVPGARYGAASWIDRSGNLWLFGGEGGDDEDKPTGYNDLWEFSPTAGTWTWVSGSSTGNTQGVYGTLGVAAAGNVPEGRVWANSWIDSSGNLWLYGGIGFDSITETGGLNDLWEFDPATGEWAWMGGTNTDNSFQAGIYGTLGVASATNEPGARNSAVGWTDSSGDFWLFGGVGLDSTGTFGYLNDLWRVQP